MYSRDAEREERLRDERVERACLEEAGVAVPAVPKKNKYPTGRKEIDVALATYWEKAFTAPALPPTAREVQSRWLQDTLDQTAGLPAALEWDDKCLEDAINK